ncbi:MAG: carbon-nitrogen hydrolase family protein [Acidobacteria bacterium]|nr:carbon-nitrogen hydrolase family protein [Acidobacteriota bacterium]
MRYLALLLFSGLLLGAPLRFHQTAFRAEAGAPPSGWAAWSARPEIAPHTFVDQRQGRDPGGSLAISGNGNPAAYGGWEYLLRGVEGDAWYRFTAWYRAAAVPAESWQVVARLDWRSKDGKRAGYPDYVYHARRDGAWTRLTLDAPAPPDAAAVKLELYLANAPQGTVWWDDISLEQIPAPAPRNVTVAAINLMPERTGSAAESVRQFLEAVNRAVPGKTDVILLPEGITVVGTGKSYVEVSEPVPGPTTERLGELARKRHSYVIAGIYERDGVAVYNTAVLLDRTGRLAGKYRKVYLPREEVEKGLTPGSGYPVFQTDFGKIGIMICYDVFFSDPARALANQGAEIIFLPIWGGNEALGKARAVEGRVFLVASGYGYPTYVMDPNGEIMASASERGDAAIAAIDLNRPYTEKWLGEMRNRRPKEQRVDVKIPLPGFEP